MATVLSAHDLKMLATAFQCFESTPKVDYDKFVIAMGWTSKGTAQTAWCNLKKKVMAWKSVDGNDDTPLPLKGSGKGKKKKAVDEDEERKDSASPAPAQKRKPKAKNVESDDEESPETTIPPRPIKRPRKPKEESKPKTESTKPKVQAQVNKTVELGFSDDGESDDETLEETRKKAKTEPESNSRKLGSSGKGDEVLKQVGFGVDEDFDDDFLAELKAYAARAAS